jgi:integrase
MAMRRRHCPDRRLASALRRIDSPSRRLLRTARHARLVDHHRARQWVTFADWRPPPGREAATIRPRVTPVGPAALSEIETAWYAGFRSIRAFKWALRHGGFPEPVRRTPSGPVWLVAQLDAWLAGELSPPDRPGGHLRPRGRWAARRGGRTPRRDRAGLNQVNQVNQAKSPPRKPRQRRSARLTPRFLVRKAGRWYWQPPRYLRELGVLPERLPDDPLEARRRAEALGEIADAVRLQARRQTAKGTPATRADLNPHPPGTVAWLIRKWAGDVEDRNTPGASPDWRRLSDRTRQDYRGHLLALREVFGRYRLAAVTPRIAHAYKAKLSDPATGLMSRQAKYRLQVLQALLAYGVRIGALETSPAIRLRLPTIPPRRAYWTDQDVERFLAADPPPSIRLALLLALETGQRQADLLHLRWSDIRDGWIELAQRKSRRAGREGKRVAIPVSQTLAAELAQAPRTGPYVVTAENTGHPYNASHFRHVFRAVTKRADLDGLVFLDCRRTAVVRLAEAGCSVGELSAITGHSISEASTILNTYHVSTRPAAESAIAKLEQRRRQAQQNVGRENVGRAPAEPETRGLPGVSP